MLVPLIWFIKMNLSWAVHSFLLYFFFSLHGLIINSKQINGKLWKELLRTISENKNSSKAVSLVTFILLLLLAYPTAHNTPVCWMPASEEY